MKPLLGYRPNEKFPAEIRFIKPTQVKRATYKSTLAVYTRDKTWNDRSKPTESIKALTDGEVKHQWRGPVVIVAMKGSVVAETSNLVIKLKAINTRTGGYYRQWRDVDLEDFRIAIDFFITHP